MRQINEERLYEKILKVLILSNYAELTKVQASAISEQDAFDYFIGKWKPDSELMASFRLNVEQTRFSARIKRDAALILNIIEEELNAPDSDKR